MDDVQIMKIALVILISVLILSCDSPMNEGGELNEEQSLQEIMQMERKIAVAFQRRDLASMDKILGDEFQITFPNTKVITKSDLMSGFRSGKIEIELVSFEEMNFRLFGNVGVLSGYVNINAKVDGEQFQGWYRVIGVVAKRNGEWQPIDEYFGLTDYKPKKK